MDFPVSSNNFSSIARRLLLKNAARRPPDSVVLFQPALENEAKVEQPPVLLAQDILGNGSTVDEPMVFLPQNDHDIKPPVEEITTFGQDDIGGYEPPVEQAATLLQQETQELKHSSDRNVLLLPVSVGPQPNPFSFPHSDVSCYSESSRNLLCERIRRLTPEMLMAPLENSFDVLRANKRDASGRLSLGRRSKVVIKRVRQFFEEFKKILGESCNGTIFNSAVQMTAMACGVSRGTVKKLGARDEFVYELFPRTKKKPSMDQESIQEATLRKYGEEWGKIVQWFIKEKLKRENMTINALHEELHKAYADFPMSRSTLYRFTKALGVTYGRNKGITYMLV